MGTPGGSGHVHAGFARVVQIVSHVGSLTAGQSTGWGPFNCEGFRQIRMQARAGVSASANGVVIDQTMDGTNYDFFDAATGGIVPAAGGVGYEVVADVVGQGVRVRYVNSNTSQAASSLRIIAYLVP